MVLFITGKENLKVEQDNRAEIVIETDDNWGDAKGTGHTCGALCEVRSCEKKNTWYVKMLKGMEKE